MEPPAPEPEPTPTETALGHIVDKHAAVSSFTNSIGMRFCQGYELPFLFHQEIIYTDV